MNFNEYGFLPPHDYEITLNELRESLLVRGPGDGEPWDVTWRLFLIDQLEVLVQQLWDVGIHQIYIDGSFVEAKAHPNDIDGYFECDVMELATGELERKLNALDPYKVWTWDSNSRKPYRGYTKKQLPMWHRYRVELYPHFGQPSGIKDEYGHDQQFPAAFRKSRDTFLPKGIIKLSR
ncbi:hypothetical protein BpOF4_06400 [Alkalihalophilus pseudofirmus OF4]|uniref:Uncharacterized protein n=1 Tax=Alkalihalophilus pseudofirmus (strain ATCC BAA-2126 / JCM 17055 / OF4) TaxID=398511 RepID=D3G065_ALKPO|nr:hypothetical protein [Alkalihalophilus pseudofirmus]ADC49340.1 hypothetical protein BpOF4_06400 [Alkalihalophilus pseudofirmus OF4]